MSRRSPYGRNRGPRVEFCCTGRGTHARRVLGVAEYHPESGAVNYEPHRTGGGLGYYSSDNFGTKMRYSLICSACRPAEYRISHERMTAVVQHSVSARLFALDVSRL